MKASRVHRDIIAGGHLVSGGLTVSTVLVEPFGYYETAILRDGAIEVVESNIADADQATVCHGATYEGAFWQG